MPVKNKNIEIYYQNQNIFSCPICFHPMQLSNKSLICSENHCFDISRHGHINMLTNSHKTKYDKQMFNSRRSISEIGFFGPLLAKISHLISERLNQHNGQVKILDAGCGEGYHLAQIKGLLGDNISLPILAVGIDIAKEGIIMAAKKHKNNIWCVTDIAKMPFKNQEFDIILNILSPSNYSEFNRVLADKGIVIKVLPNGDYLQELREIIYKDTAQESYSNAATVELFKNNLNLIDIEEIKYKKPIDKANLENLIFMTPMSWGANASNIKTFLEHKISEVTVDFTILVGESS